ncbi:MAG TPA: carbohydrate ABC transporter permease, partial [Clostridia bacterium]|nr:carbohydrate ABC transporter permease [Clostridia bacterium]
MVKKRMSQPDKTHTAVKRRVLRSGQTFDIVNGFILLLLASSCVLPFVNVLAVSLSTPSMADAGMVGLLPVGFTVEAYRFAFSRANFV